MTRNMTSMLRSLLAEGAETEDVRWLNQRAEAIELIDALELHANIVRQVEPALAQLLDLAVMKLVDNELTGVRGYDSVQQNRSES